MAYFDAENANKAIRERINGTLVGTAGSLIAARAITPQGNIGTDARAGGDPSTNEIKAINVPAVLLTPSMRRHESSPPWNSNVAFYHYDVKLTLTYNLPNAAQTEATFNAFRATAQYDLDRISQALGSPGALLTTLAGDATGIVSGMLWQTSPHTISAEDDSGAMVAEVTFSGTAFVAPANS